MPKTTDRLGGDVRAAFALAGSSKDRALAALYSVVDACADPEMRIELSNMVRHRLRSFVAEYLANNPEPPTAHLANGLSVEVDLRDLFGAELYVGHCNEAGILSALAATLPAGARTIDVGANFGIYALHAGMVAGSQGSVVAYEAAPDIVSVLERNVKSNGLDGRVIVRHAAVSDVNGTADFHIAEDVSFSGLRNTKRSPILQCIEVETVRLDDELPVKSLGPIDFLKIDVEGAEAGVLAGAHEVIANSPNITVLLEYSYKNLTHEAETALKQQLSFLIEQGLHGWAIDSAAKVKRLKSVSRIASDFNGSLLFTAGAAGWAEDFLQSLRKGARTKGASFDTSIFTVLKMLLSDLKSHAQSTVDLQRMSADLPEDAGEPPAKRVQRHIARSQIRFDRSENENAALRDQLQTQTSKLEAVRASNEGMKMRMAQREEEIDQLRGRLDSRAGEHETLKRALATKTSEIESLVSKSEMRMRAYETVKLTLERKESEIEALASKNEALDSVRQELLNLVAAARADSEVNKNKLIKRVESETALRASNLQQSEKVQALRNQIGALSESIDQLHAELKRARAELGNSAARIERLNFEAAENSAEAELLARQNRSMAKSLGAANEQLDAFRAAGSNQHKKVTALREQIAQLMRRLQDDERVLVEKEGRIASLTDELNNKIQLVDELTQTCERRRDQIRQLQQANALYSLKRGRLVNRRS